MWEAKRASVASVTYHAVLCGMAAVYGECSHNNGNAVPAWFASSTIIARRVIRVAYVARAVIVIPHAVFDFGAFLALAIRVVREAPRDPYALQKRQG